MPDANLRVPFAHHPLGDRFDTQLHQEPQPIVGDQAGLTRTVFDQVPPKVVYDIADAERPRLRQVLDVLCDWGLYWCDKTGARVLALERTADDSRS